jgi:hypothetical protein
MVSMKSELLAEIRRRDTRIDAVDRERRTAIDIRERLRTLEARRAGATLSRAMAAAAVAATTGRGAAARALRGEDARRR